MSNPIAVSKGQLAVIFISRLRKPSPEYSTMGQRMVELAQEQDGFISVVSSTRDAEGNGITISIWRDREAVANWKRQSEHLVAQKLGKEAWYASFQLIVTAVEYHYDFVGAQLLD
jgi:heme-degrading monooxygenase HmoA